METMILEELIVIARLGSFSRAAEELNISQSALSKHILALERELGLQLLVRTSRQVQLSEAGQSLLPIAQEICRMERSFRMAAEEQRRRSSGSLHIVSIPVMAHYGITEEIARFRQAHPEIRLTVEECEQQELPERLKSGECELAFTRMTEELADGVEYRVLQEDALVAVLQPGHPLLQLPTVTPRQLQDQPLLLMDRHTGLHDIYRLLFEQAGIRPNTAYEGHRPENIIALAAQGMGIGLLMQGHPDYLAAGDVEIRPLEPEISVPICLAWRSGSHLSPAARLFLQEIPDRNESSGNRN